MKDISRPVSAWRRGGRKVSLNSRRTRATASSVAARLTASTAGSTATARAAFVHYGVIIAHFYDISAGITERKSK
jgi:hypothetical protein